MKKISIALLLCITLISTSVFAATFPDLNEGNWAYSAVEKMVSDGRVNGFPDGTFKPDEMVTRWQFVKMSGGNLDDVSNPDELATRDYAATTLWERAGKPEKIASGAVTKGSDNPKAVAWAYTMGVMKGDDGLNLRLSDGLTRAEAATMIVRAEGTLTTNNFISTVDPVIFKRVWDSMPLDIEYNPDATLTNGQLARLAVQIVSNDATPDYYGMREKPNFEGEYANDIQYVAEGCLGLDKANAEYMNKTANRFDMVALLGYYSMLQATGNIPFKAGKMYSDCNVDSLSNIQKFGLEFARYNEVFFTAEDKINPTADATMKDVACVLTQLDEMIGLSYAYGQETRQTRLLKTNGYWPSNASDYPYIINEIPAELYETPLLAGAKPVDYFEFARRYYISFNAFLSGISKTFPESVKAEWTLWPSLIAGNDDETVLRVKLDIKENPENLSLNQILSKNIFDKPYYGDSFIVDISTGQYVIDVIIDATKYYAIRAFN